MRETKLITGNVICLKCHQVRGVMSATHSETLNGYVCHPCLKEITIDDKLVKNPEVIKELYVTN